MEKEIKKGTINERFLNLVTAKRNQIFRKVLTALETECKRYNIDEDFFTKSPDTKKGYGLVRKILLDDINDLVRFISLVLEKVEIQPIKAIIKIDQKVLDSVQSNPKNAEIK